MTTLPYKTTNKKHEWADMLEWRGRRMKKAGRKNKIKFYRTMLRL